MKISNELMLSVFTKLKDTYYKSLFVNFSNDEFVVLKPPADEDFLADNKSSKISDYFKWFASSELIHQEDVAKFLRFAENPLNHKEVLYRRKINGEYKNVVMRITELPYYTEESKECFLYVTDVDNLFKEEYRKIAERLARTDDATKLLNKYAFSRDIQKKMSGYVGVIYCDLNALKYVNDKCGGHEAGDAYILRFADMLKTQFNEFDCYRIGGDEFVAISADINIPSFIQRSVAFHKFLWRDERYPIASVGYSADVADNLPSIISAAEKAMYEDKDMFARAYPDLKRK